MYDVNIYSDGASKGNPGPGGFGTIVRFTDKDGKVHERKISAGFKDTTNNRMELMGVIAGLKILNNPCNITIISDSKYVIDAISKGWVESWKRKGWKNSQGQATKNVDLWEQYLEVSRFHTVTTEWIKGHNGHTENEMCDQMACHAATAGELLDDIR